jgi:signal transduction histidine kinase
VVTLEKSAVFAGLKPQEHKLLKAIAQKRRYAAGLEIFKEGDAGDGIYLLREGAVEISVLVGPTRHVFSRVEPGDIFGEMAVIEDKPRSASAIAIKDTQLAFFARGDLLKLVEDSPALAMALLREISSRLREFNLQHLREVVQAERLAVIGRFARSIIHDLKNPLNIIGLTAEVAGMEHTTAENRRDAVTNIRVQVDRISELVSEILEFTQGSSPELVLPPMSYAEFVHDMLGELRPEGALKSIAIELENPPPDVSIVLNPKRMRRAFYNLFHNAAEAMPEGGKVILRFRTENGSLVTEIEDTGPGIAPEIAGQLFQAFATYGKEHGTGLGLSICRRIIEDHKGWITARDQPGRGAIFTFGLPVVQ